MSLPIPGGRWTCPRCGEVVITAFLRNLVVLADEHRRITCPRRDIPLERPITDGDKKFLEELKVGW